MTYFLKAKLSSFRHLSPSFTMKYNSSIGRVPKFLTHVQRLQGQINVDQREAWGEATALRYTISRTLLQFLDNCFVNFDLLCSVHEKICEDTRWFTVSPTVLHLSYINRNMERVQSFRQVQENTQAFLFTIYFSRDITN